MHTDLQLHILHEMTDNQVNLYELLAEANCYSFGPPHKAYG